MGHGVGKNDALSGQCQPARLVYSRPRVLNVCIIPHRGMVLAAKWQCRLKQTKTNTVYRGIFKNQPVAIKQFALDNPNIPRSKSFLLNEASELMQLSHGNVKRCYGVWYEIYSIVLELAAKQIIVGEETCVIHSLRQLLETVEIPIDLQHEALFQISIGLEYLHEKRVVHGDLKSANVLLTGDSSFIFKLGILGKFMQQSLQS